MNRREFLKTTLLGAMAAAVPVLAREPEPVPVGLFEPARGAGEYYISCAGGEFRVNCGEWVTEMVPIKPGDSIQMRAWAGPHNTLAVWTLDNPLA